ncbi:MAG: hypothetical protein V3V00_15975 [Saprospiraceae bacterium]
MVTIPWFDLASFEEEVTLDGTPFILSLKWISRSGFWTISFADREQNDLLTGRKLVHGGELLRQFTTRDLPPGMMFPTDETGNPDPILQDDFINGRMKLVYVEEDEIS